MIAVLDHISDFIQRILQFLLAVMSVVLLVVNIAQICGRYLFFYSLPWSEELSTYLFIWVIFLGVHLIIRENAELRIDAITFSNYRRQQALELLRDILSWVAILFFFVGSLQMMRNAIAFPQRAASLPVNTYVIYAVMPVGYLLMGLQKFTNLLKRVENLRRGRPAPGGVSDEGEG